MNETSLLDNTLKQLKRIWGTEDVTLSAYDHPLNDTDEDLLNRYELKDLLPSLAVLIDKPRSTWWMDDVYWNVNLLTYAREGVVCISCVRVH